jgi:hypothetical protein
VLDEDLGRAALAALEIPRMRCRAHAQTFSWRRCAEQFVENLRPVDDADATEIRPAAE